MSTTPADLERTSRWTHKFIDLLFPTVCAACGKLGPIICSECLNKFSEISGPTCLRCGRRMAETSEFCRYCRGEDFNLKQSRACFAYSEPLESVIKRFKYDGLFALARPLGKLMAQKWPEWTQPLDIIVPIPLHARRQRSRGFNQAQLLAHYLGPSVGIEVNDRVLRRVRYTKPQIELSPPKRKENVWAAFAANPSGVKGKNILLLDDVFTTGATTTSAANTLLEAGAKSVSAYCLARTVQ